ncbi:phosphoglycerate mutase-like protein [Russula emetica]|nr:phosphoglycerate mutase-like protein [Russula emetica]
MPPLLFRLFKHFNQSPPSPCSPSTRAAWYRPSPLLTTCLQGHLRLSETPDYFGLVSKSWTEFVDAINELHAKRPDSVSYKVLFLGRHGEGSHNVAIDKYSPKYSRTWAVKKGDGELTWGRALRHIAVFIRLADLAFLIPAADPRLTSIGEEQARSAHAAWEREILRGLPVPQKFYCSPLTRAIRTLQLTFEGILPADLKPIIVENCREHNGAHFCDKRRPKSEVQSEFPDFVFEEGFEEEDVTWTSERESRENMVKRAKLVLDRIFQDDRDDTYISITAHSGSIKSVLRVLGRGDYNIQTGGLVVVVVKGTVQ